MISERLAIIGVGLIGGSLALALRRAGACREVVGAGRSAEHLRQAQRLGIIDRFETDPARAAAGADLVVVAVPVGAMEGVFHALAPALEPQAVLTDVGSTKVSVLAAARAAFGALPARFVPGHPIAGTERSGAEAAFPDLFRGRKVILTPSEETAPPATARVQSMWEQCGASVVQMSAEHHDQVLAATSHLPHVLAYTLVDTLARLNDRQEVFAFAAGGFRDFTRIASSDPLMWRDICLANRDALLAVLERYRGDLDALATALRGADGEALLRTFQAAKTARDALAGALGGEGTSS